MYIKHGGTQLHDCSVSSRVFATVLPADRCFPLAYILGACKILKSQLRQNGDASAITPTPCRCVAMACSRQLMQLFYAHPH